MGKKIVVIVISVLLLLLGAGFTAAGGALMALFGSGQHGDIGTATSVDPDSGVGRDCRRHQWHQRVRDDRQQGTVAGNCDQPGRGCSSSNT